jgi:hypothetical protein
MKKFKHIPTGKICIYKHGGNGFLETETGQVPLFVLESGADWEEMPQEKPKEYEILSFISIKQTFDKDLGQIAYIKNGEITAFDGSITMSVEDVLKNWVGIHRTWGIHSVKHLSDGEVFTVGDRVEHKSGDKGKLQRFSIDGNNMILFCDADTLYCSIKNFKKLVPCLTTEDGIEIYEGDPLYAVFPDFSIFPYKPWYCYYSTKPGTKLFSIAEKAGEYIEWNLPRYSRKDMQSIYDEVMMVNSDAEWFKKNYLKDVS